MRQMSWFLVLAAAFLTVPAYPAPPPETFSSSVDLVRLEVVVQDAHGRYLRDLTKHDFTIWEDGVKQEVATFSHENIPLDLTFMFDGSDSMLPVLKEIYQAAGQFIDALHPDTVQIIQFSQRVQVLEPPTGDMVEVQGFLSMLTLFADSWQKVKLLDPRKPENIVRRESLKEWLCNRSMCGSTALYTSLYAVNDHFTRAPHDEGERRRQAIILITDGEDTTSKLTDDDVIGQTTRLDTPIYTICLRLSSLVGIDYDPHKVDHFLEGLSQKTGGSSVVMEKTMNFSGPYSRIGSDLQSPYHLEYAASNVRHDGAWRTIQVSTNRTETALRHKQGYYAPCDPSQSCAKKK